MKLCFSPIEQRSSQFADWYFAYPTSIKLLRAAAPRSSLEVAMGLWVNHLRGLGPKN